MGAHDTMQKAEILAWRKLERSRLIQARLAIPPTERRIMSTQISESVLGLVGPVGGRTISFYWPMRGEPDLRLWLGDLPQAGAQACLPVVVAKGAPLQFRTWQRGDRLVKGVWNIPIPAEGAEVTPDIVIAPVVGYDTAGYRLGYGGGYFDRTLAVLTPRPQIIGVGYSYAAIETINPLPHDIPMDVIITERGVLRPPHSEGFTQRASAGGLNGGPVAHTIPRTVLAFPGYGSGPQQGAPAANANEGLTVTGHDGPVRNLGVAHGLDRRRDEPHCPPESEPKWSSCAGLAAARRDRRDVRTSHDACADDSPSPHRASHKRP